MIHHSTFAISPLFKLPVTEPVKKNIGSLNIVKRKKIAGIIEISGEKLKPQQLMAAAIFHLFELNIIYTDNANKHLAYLANGTESGAIDADFTNPSNKISQLMQLAHELGKCNEKGTGKAEIFRNTVSDYASELTQSPQDGEVISFSKVNCEKEAAIVYNTSDADANEKFVLMHCDTAKENIKMTTVYGYENCAHVHLFRNTVQGKNISYIKIYLKPLQLIVLKNY